jgi:hypothetical protein
MDTTQMEYTAEDLIAHKLQRAEILVAKPKFDTEGADLLGFLCVSDGAKFCRIQCKGRSLLHSKQAAIDIPKIYVTDGFLCFLFVETNQKEQTNLFCFLGKEIRYWKSKVINKTDSYVLHISPRKLQNEFGPYIFNESRVHEIKKLIMNIDVKGEFRKVLHIYGDLTLPSPTMKGIIDISNP